MSEALHLLLATLLSFAAMLGFALAKDAHWGQVMPKTAKPEELKLSNTTRRRLRGLGASGLTLSLWACWQADPPSMAVLEWVMLLSVGASGSALVLARRPGWLLPLCLRCRDRREG